MARVIEGFWAQEFRVAQASIREAIDVLIAGGFLTKDSGRSARVIIYPEQDVAALYQVRRALEGLAAYLVLQNSDKRLLVPLFTIVLLRVLKSGQGPEDVELRKAMPRLRTVRATIVPSVRDFGVCSLGESGRRGGFAPGG